MREMLRTMDQDTLLSLFFNREDSDRYSMGYIRRMDDAHVVFSAVAPDGRWDGYILRRLDDLCRMEYGSDYETKVAHLHGIRGKGEEGFDLEAVGGRLLDGFLAAVQHGGDIVGVAVEGNDDITYGIIAAATETTITVNMLDKFGRPYGAAVLERDGVDFLEVRSVECRTLGHLASCEY